MNDESQKRRELLRALVSGGALGAAGLSGFMSRALAAGDIPGGTGIARLEGSATVNGQPAKVGTAVKLGDRIVTGAGAKAVVVLKGDAFLLHQKTIIEVKGRDNVLTDMLVSGGRVLSVFSKKPVAIKAAVATIGIRGTGAYLEVEPGSVYFCLCYGEARVEGANMEARTVKTTHHETPLMLRETGGILRAEPGGFKGHSDDELILLESLVGREPPFVKSGAYPANKY
ncbi:MAG: hypothetical protein ABIR98_13030 [Usitatibacter sp.]